MFNYKKSDYFWGILIILILLYIFSIHVIAIVIIQALISIALIVILIHNHVEDMYAKSIKPKYIKLPIFFIVNPIAILSLLVWGVIWIINNPVKRFNTWMDKEKERRLKFKEFAKEEIKK